MWKKPNFILSDDEGALNSNDILGYLKKEGIEKITTKSHSHFAERFIRSFKFLLYKRIDHDMKQGKTDLQWTNYIFPVLTVYNFKNDHSSIGMTPAEAKRDEARIEVKLNMGLKAKHSRKYPPLQVGDKVKIMLNYSKFKKERDPLYSDNKYEIEKIEEQENLKLYTVNGRQRLRTELLKVN